jgi:GNAT superfamily N-acetyltransferase
MTNKPEFSIRHQTEHDQSYILNTWLMNFRCSNHLERMIRHNVYFEEQTHLIQKILTKSKVIVAVDLEHDSQIFGYLVYNEVAHTKIIHYVYVKSPFRRLGIATALKDFVFGNVDDDDGKYPILTTHYTRMSPLLNIKWNLTFNPYLLLDIYSE